MSASRPPPGVAVTVTEAVASRLREDIRSRRFAPGDRLRQTSIARELGVSTTPVREAFMVLEREGLVSRADRRGVVVFNPTFEDLREIFLIRIPLETLATELAVPNLTASEIDTLERLLHAGEEAHALRDVEGSLIIGDAFHTILYRAAQQPRLTALIESLVSASASYVNLTAGTASTRPEIDAAHEAILDACRARDPHRAGEAMGRHVSTALDVLTAELAKRRAAAGAGAGAGGPHDDAVQQT